MEESEQQIILDGVSYNVDEMSASAKEQLANLQFVEAQLQQLKNELAVADTARIGYTNALKAGMLT
jgi:hypothetical protein